MDYELGLSTLKVWLPTNARDEFHVHEAKLRDNLHRERLFGSTETIRAERAAITYALNQLAQRHCGVSFNDLCMGQPVSPASPTQQLPTQEVRTRMARETGERKRVGEFEEDDQTIGTRFEGIPVKGIEVFVSYSHKDEKLREQLEKHLSILTRQGVITVWHDRKIGAGKEWKGQIDSHLNSANIVLLLVSPDFLASDYCYDVEMQRAMERHDVGEARVIPVILRDVDWKGAPFSKLQALPRDAKPVTRWRDHDEAFRNVAEGIRAAVEELSANP